VASHYMLPGLGYDMDGMTHVSATTRLGFAYTRSSAGISYQDMRDLFSQQGAFDISTTFNPSLYAEDPTMVDDPRLAIRNQQHACCQPLLMQTSLFQKFSHLCGNFTFAAGFAHKIQSQSDDCRRSLLNRSFHSRFFRNTLRSGSGLPSQLSVQVQVSPPSSVGNSKFSAGR